MNWKFALGLLFMVVWLAVAWMKLPISTFWAIAIPLLLSILTTVTDEAAESGAAQFRGGTATLRSCINVQWAFAAFYLLLASGIAFADAPTKLKAAALGFAVLSVVFGSVSAATNRRYAWVGVLLAPISFVIVLVFGMKIA